MSPRTRARKQIDPLEQAMEKALAPGGYISYEAAWAFVDNVQEVQTACRGNERLVIRNHRILAPRIRLSFRPNR